MNTTAEALQRSAGPKGEQGYAGVIAAPETRKLVLYWNGELTPAARAAIARSTVPVVVKSAPHTAEELSRAAARIPRLAERVGVRLTEVTKPQDGRGLNASVEGNKAQANRLERAVAKAGWNVPVTVNPRGAAHTLLNRESDPNYGGAQMVAPVCSTAFAVRYQGRDAMLTADHCFHPDHSNQKYAVRHPNGTPVLGPFGERVSPDAYAENHSSEIDVAVLSQIGSTAYGPRVWIGGRAGEVPPSAQSTAVVHNARKPQTKNWVCQSGARSGEVCNIQVIGETELYAVDIQRENGTTTRKFYSGGWQAKKRVTASDPGTYAGRRGDSGGPVYYTAKDAGTGTAVTAAGIVSAGTGTGSACETGGGGRTTCFKTMIFAGIDEALNSLDRSLPPGTPADQWSALTATGLSDHNVRRHLNFRGEQPNRGPAFEPENGLRTQLVSENGVAIAYDPTKSDFDGVIKGYASADWEMHQYPNGNWSFQNVSHPALTMSGENEEGYSLIPVGDDLVQLKWHGGCLKAEVILVGSDIGNIWTSPCDATQSSQKFRLAPIADSTSGPLDPVPPAERVFKEPYIQPTAGPGLAMMPLGDSITLGVGSTTGTGYRPLLARRLADTTDKLRYVGSMQDPDGTRHEGHSGWRIDQLQTSIGPWLTEAKPNVVLLHIGTNDMDRDHQASTAPQRLGALVDQIHTASPSTAVVLASLVPAADPAVQARVTTYNRAIPGIVADRAARGYRITQVSMDALTTADLDDKLHPNNSGYQKMAESFLGGIATLSRNGWITEKIDVKPLPPQRAATIGDYDVDINDDGRADYLAVDDNGAVRAWANTARPDGTVKWTDLGYIASGSSAWTGDQVRFADVGGDARADYLIVEPNGATRALINQGGNGRGGWRYQGYIASGSSAWTGDQVRFADVGGDARADYLIVEPNGATRAFITTTNATTGTVKMTDHGVIASGSSAWTGDQVRFADVGGDARADYLIVEPNGATRAFINQGGNGRGGWNDLGTVATGSTAWNRDQVRFSDINGDGKADYLILADNGALRAFINTNPPTGPVKWSDQGVIATGTGAPSNRVRI